MNRAAAPQLPLQFTRRGGPRPGAGRPRKKDARVSHLARPRFTRPSPLHTTIRVRREVPNLRSSRCFGAVERTLLIAQERLGMRVIDFAVLGNHVHLIVEAEDNAALSRGMQGLNIRLAKALNRALGRHGTVFADHFHSRLLRTPTEVVNAIRYVHQNAAHHFPGLPPGPDAFSSLARPDLTAQPRTWLLRVGWSRANPRRAAGSASTGRQGHTGSTAIPSSVATLSRA